MPFSQHMIQFFNLNFLNNQSIAALKRNTSIKLEIKIKIKTNKVIILESGSY
jgi:hypothetical protein